MRDYKIFFIQRDLSESNKNTYLLKTMEKLPIVVPLLKKFIEQHNNYFKEFFIKLGYGYCG